MYKFYMYIIMLEKTHMRVFHSYLYHILYEGVPPGCYMNKLILARIHIFTPLKLSSFNKCEKIEMLLQIYNFKLIGLPPIYEK